MINNLKNIRIAKGMTQEELARKCNISLRQIQNIEYNKNIPKIDIALKIKEQLECFNVEEIFKLEK